MKRFLIGLNMVLFLSTFSSLYSQSWTKLSDFPDSLGWYGAGGFSINGKGFVGGAGGRGSSFTKEFYEYDPFSDSWTQKASLPDSSNRRTVASFSIGSYGYLGVGWTGSKSLYSFYKYDPSNNTWSQVADYPGVGGRVNLYASLNGKGYVGGGAIGVGDQQKDFWEYDPVSDSWTKKANLPTGGRAGGIAFAIDSLLYITGGQNGSINLKDVWAYNPSTNSWSQRASFPGVGRIHPTSFVISGKAIVGGGYIWGTGVGLSDYYEYDPATNQWTSIVGFSGGNRGICASFTIQNEGYTCIGRGPSNSIYLDDLWKYSQCNTNYSIVTMTFCDSLTSPSGKNTWNSPGVYFDTVANSGGCDSILQVSLISSSINLNLSQSGNMIQSLEMNANKYQWIMCNDTIVVLLGDTFRTINNIKNGVSYGVIIRKHNCLDTTDCVAGITGIESIKDEKIEVYPNPVRDYLYIKINSPNLSSYMLYDPKGRLVKEGIIREFIDMSNIKSGLYYLHIHDKSSNVQYKILKE